MSSKQPWTWPRAFATAAEAAATLGVIYCLARCTSGGTW